MLVTELKDLSRPLVTAIADDCIHVAGRRYDGTILLHGDQVHTDNVPERFDAIDRNALSAVLDDRRPEILIIGCGRRSRLPNRELRRALHETGVGFEVMPTPAAARTYNLIVAEGRRVSAFLILGD